MLINTKNLRLGRLGLAVADRPQLSIAGTEVHQILLHGAGAPLAQREVVLLVAALVAGVGMVSLDLVYGIFWSKAITVDGVTPDVIVSRSDTSAGIIALVGIVMCLGTWLFLTCCGYMLHLKEEPRTDYFILSSLRGKPPPLDASPTRLRSLDNDARRLLL